MDSVLEGLQCQGGGRGGAWRNRNFAQQELEKGAGISWPGPQPGLNFGMCS